MERYFNDYSTFLKEINESKYQLSNHQNIRLVHAFSMKYFNFVNNEFRNKIICKFLDIKMFEKCHDNLYIIALSFYKDIILNLKEISALSIQYLQLDNYILTNYFKDEKQKYIH